MFIPTGPSFYAMTSPKISSCCLSPSYSDQILCTCRSMRKEERFECLISTSWTLVTSLLSGGSALEPLQKSSQHAGRTQGSTVQLRQRLSFKLLRLMRRREGDCQRGRQEGWRELEREGEIEGGRSELAIAIFGGHDRFIIGKKSNFQKKEESRK